MLRNLRKILTLIILLPVFSSFNLIYMLASNADLNKTIHTNKSNFYYKIKSNADRIEYELKYGNLARQRAAVHLTNPHEKVVEKSIPLKLYSEGTYNLKYTLFDEVENKSKEFHQKIIFDKTAPTIKLLKLSICGDNICAKLRVADNFSKYVKVYEVKQNGGKYFGNTDSQDFYFVAFKSFEEKRKYDFTFKAIDRAGNTTFKNASITTPKSDPSGGDVYGADPNNPWGKDNDYHKKKGLAGLVINSEIIGGGYRFFSVKVPDPLLTYTQTVGDNVTVYGTAPSKNTQFDLYVDKWFPSYFEAVDYCSDHPLKRLIKFGNSSEGNCIRRALGIGMLSRFYESIEKKCAKYFWPTEKYSCQQRYLNRREKRYLGVYKLKYEHVRVGFRRMDNKEFHHLWQEGNVKFSFTTKKLKPGENIYAIASVYGYARFGNKKFDYGKFENSSYGSNNLTIKSPEDRAARDIPKCRNGACKVLDVNYFNQGVNDKGRWETWPSWYYLAGGKSCGASSSVMVNDYLGKLPKNKYRLKSFVFQDNGQSLRNKKCNRPGAFAVTSYSSSCNASSLGSIRDYLSQYGLKTSVYWPTGANNNMSQIKNALKSGRPVILSYKRPIGHILVVKGFTYDDHLIVNDPYRDIQNNYIKGRYDYSGKNAIYSLYPSSRFKLNYLIEVYK